MITEKQAMESQTFHYIPAEPDRIERWRRNGKTKTWKRKPGYWEIPVKHGIYSYDRIDSAHAHLIHTEEDCPLGKN